MSKLQQTFTIKVIFHWYTGEYKIPSMLLKRHVSKLGQEITVNQMLRGRLNLHEMYKAVRDEAVDGRKELVTQIVNHPYSFIGCKVQCLIGFLIFYFSQETGELIQIPLILLVTFSFMQRNDRDK